MPDPTSPLLRWEARERSNDRHVRRSGADYTQALLALLPQGQAWPRWIDCTNDETTLLRVHRGLADYWGFVDGRAADLLERESDPRKTVELLPDYERNFGLPDPCFPDATTIAERQRMLVLYMTYLGGQSREYFTELMKWLGFDVHIKEHAPFMVGVSQVGDTRPLARTRYDWAPDRIEDGALISRPVPSGWVPRPGNELPDNRPDDNFRYYIGDPTMRFVWTANTGKMGLVWFRAGSGQAGVDHHLQFRTPQDLECLLNRWAPAHTHLAMDVGHRAFSDPMEGTFDPLIPNPIRWPSTAPHERL